jgi:hypothetical protein
MKRTRNFVDDAFDENGLLKDVRTYRAGLYLMDSGDRVLQRTLRNTHRPGAITDGTDNPFALHRPGFRIRTDAGMYDARQAVLDARAAYLEDLQNAWKHPVGLGSVPGVATGVGQQGARSVGKEDVVPDAPKVSSNDATPVDDIETAYRLYAEEISQAWTTPR